MGYEQDKEKTEGRSLRRDRASGLFESQKVESGMTGMGRTKLERKRALCDGERGDNKATR
jgi:hypothetical protein